MASQDKSRQVLSTKGTSPSAMESLMNKLDIGKDQVNMDAGKVESVTGGQFPNGQTLKQSAKDKVNGLNSSQGEHIRFSAIKRNGFQTDANGDKVLDADGKPTPSYDLVTVSGHFVIDKHKVGKDGVQYYEVTKVLTHPRSYTIADYQVLSDE